MGYTPLGQREAAEDTALTLLNMAQSMLSSWLAMRCMDDVSVGSTMSIVARFCALKQGISAKAASSVLAWCLGLVIKTLNTDLMRVLLQH